MARSTPKLQQWEIITLRRWLDALPVAQRQNGARHYIAGEMPANGGFPKYCFTLCEIQVDGAEHWHILPPTEAATCKRCIGAMEQRRKLIED